MMIVRKNDMRIIKYNKFALKNFCSLFVKYVSYLRIKTVLVRHLYTSLLFIIIQHYYFIKETVSTYVIIIICFLFNSVRRNYLHFYHINTFRLITYYFCFQGKLH